MWVCPYLPSRRPYEFAGETMQSKCSSGKDSSSNWVSLIVNCERAASGTCSSKARRHATMSSSDMSKSTNWMPSMSMRLVPDLSDAAVMYDAFP